MKVQNESVEIEVEGQLIAGTFYRPDDPCGRALFAHGWAGNQQQYVRRACAVAELGYLCLTFDFRGHGALEGERETVSRADSMRDLLAAYDLLAAQPNTASRAIGIVGSSYGAYLAAIASSVRPIQWLALRAPALYKDADWQIPKLELHRDPDFAAYRRRALEPERNKALQACAQFRGDILVVESEADETVPHQVIENYLGACKNARSVTWRMVKGADHGLNEDSWQRQSTSYLLDWLSERHPELS